MSGVGVGVGVGGMVAVEIAVAVDVAVGDAVAVEVGVPLGEAQTPLDPNRVSGRKLLAETTRGAAALFWPPRSPEMRFVLHATTVVNDRVPVY